ncbi:MAG: hypothetical protein RBR35_03265 [Salinivirgaceae bacterium]|nr:hypothetical protein [Salinivirgaceae bacterium]
MRNIALIIVSFIVISFFSITDLLGQHRVITALGDTLNCSYIEVDLEMEEVVCQEFMTDSVYVFNPDLVTSIKYHFFPKFPNLKQPNLIVSANIGIAITTYLSAMGNIETQPILVDGMKRGVNYNMNLEYYHNAPLGLAVGANYLFFKNDKDTVWAQESFKTAGIGVSYLSKGYINELFIMAQAIITYSDYQTKGNMPSFTFKEHNTLWGLQTSGSVNYHITELVLMSFGGKLHFMHKKPHQVEKVTNINLAIFEMNLGFKWMW